MGRGSAGPCTHKSRLLSSGWSLSALPPKADIRQRIEHVCFVPIADINRTSTEVARDLKPLGSSPGAGTLSRALNQIACTQTLADLFGSRQLAAQGERGFSTYNFEISIACELIDDFACYPCAQGLPFGTNSRC